jgi:hypothetical protein
LQLPLCRLGLLGHGALGLHPQLDHGLRFWEHWAAGRLDQAARIASRPSST